ncbi:DUF418 domain-containing protein [Lysobacter sp. CA196]|uniref:DUF418 domain-containing protein n=1 Tax=Lysobacter sp. CA196 TaxID=3455606 RepID=UPI003F8CF6CA
MAPTDDSESMSANIAAPGLAPIPAHERLLALDALRGLALLGIFLSNAEMFTRPLTDISDGIDAQLRGLDHAASAFVYVAIRSKFWTLFSLLFGMGFAVMFERSRQAGRAFRPLYLRRSVGLLAIGLVHAWFIWAGDILVTYALAAFALFAMRSLSPGVLWRIGLCLYLSVLGFFLMIAVVLAIPGVAQSTAADSAADRAERAAEIAAYAHGDYAQATAQRLAYFAGETVSSWFSMVPMVLGLFLIGAWFVRSGTLADPAAHRHRLKSMIAYGVPAGVALTGLSLLIDSSPTFTPVSAASVAASTLHMLGALPLALALIAGVVLIVHGGARWPLRFAPAGRMALSNYLAQSLIGTLAFYGYGVGLWGQVPLAALIAATFAVFALQMLLSAAWLQRYRFGPIEWLWRAFTYWGWPPMRVRTS